MELRTHSQRGDRLSLGMDKQCHPRLYWSCNHLSMLRLKLNHVYKGPLFVDILWIIFFNKDQFCYIQMFFFSLILVIFTQKSILSLLKTLWFVVKTEWIRLMTKLSERAVCTFVITLPPINFVRLTKWGLVIARSFISRNRIRRDNNRAYTSIML